jgi:hypothetical protein
VHVVVGLAISASLLRHGLGRPASKNERAIVDWWMRRATRILGLDIKVVGVRHEEPVLMVSNHISWLDTAAGRTQADGIVSIGRRDGVDQTAPAAHIDGGGQRRRLAERQQQRHPGEGLDSCRAHSMHR